MCQGILLAAACVDKPDHLTLVNAARYAGDEEVLSQEEGEREGGAAEGEGGRCCCALAYNDVYRGKILASQSLTSIDFQILPK